MDRPPRSKFRRSSIHRMLVRWSKITLPIGNRSPTLEANPRGPIPFGNLPHGPTHLVSSSSVALYRSCTVSKLCCVEVTHCRKLAAENSVADTRRFHLTLPRAPTPLARRSHVCLASPQFWAEFVKTNSFRIVRFIELGEIFPQNSLVSPSASQENRPTSTKHNLLPQQALPPCPWGLA